MELCLKAFLWLTPAAVCKCRQTYLKFTQWRLYPAWKALRIVPFKRPCTQPPRVEAGGERGEGLVDECVCRGRGGVDGPHTVLDSLIRGEIPPSLPPPLPPLSVALAAAAAAALIRASIQRRPSNTPHPSQQSPSRLNHSD